MPEFVVTIRHGNYLLRLSNGHTSLEFASSDLSSVAAAIQKLFGIPETDRSHAFLTAYRFGGSSFVFQNEWDDPCLISGTDEGDEILRQFGQT
jgi:hypothetical protein